MLCVWCVCVCVCVCDGDMGMNGSLADSELTWDSISPVFALGWVKRLKVTGLGKLPGMTVIHTSTLSPSSTVYPVRSNPTTRVDWARRQRLINSDVIQEGKLLHSATMKLYEEHIRTAHRVYISYQGWYTAYIYIYYIYISYWARGWCTSHIPEFIMKTYTEFAY